MLLFALACNGPAAKQKGMACITERKTLAGGKLLMKYHFKHAGGLMQDSVEIANKVVPQDSVSVVFSVQNPAENQLQLP